MNIHTMLAELYEKHEKLKEITEELYAARERMRVASNDYTEACRDAYAIVSDAWVKAFPWRRGSSCGVIFRIKGIDSIPFLEVAEPINLTKFEEVEHVPTADNTDPANV